LRAVDKRRIREFLERVFLKAALFTAIGVDGHGSVSIKTMRAAKAARETEILPANPA
jgi:hypothetical protein